MPTDTVTNGQVAVTDAPALVTTAAPTGTPTSAPDRVTIRPEPS